MKFKQNANVSTAEGREIGHIDRVVIDPLTKKVTHVVVRKGLLFADERVVPIGMVAEATENYIHLREGAGDPHHLPKFEESRYVRVPEDDGGRSSPASGIYANSPYGPAPAAGNYPEFGHSGPQYVPRVEQNIPEGTVALREGARVIADDGQMVGHVEEVLADAASEEATHFLISRGLLTKERKLIPTLWVREIEENEIYLITPANVLEKLHSY
jgi:uncharacterized protein YrrD